MPRKTIREHFIDKAVSLGRLTRAQAKPATNDYLIAHIREVQLEESRAELKKIRAREKAEREGKQND